MLLSEVATKVALLPTLIPVPKISTYLAPIKVDLSPRVSN
jgi:hypothetical protein